MPFGWVAAGATAISGIAGAVASENAAGDQEQAAQSAQQISENEFNTIQQQNAPFIQAGYGALSDLNYLEGIGTPGTAASYPTGPNASGGGVGTPGTASSSTAGGYGSLTTPFTTANWQQLSPQYNFNLQQGQQNVLNADAAGQGSLSGAALKDLTNYNQSAANNSFNSAFANYTTQQNNIFSRLSGIAGLGQSSANNTGQQGTTLAGQAAGSALAGGAYQAAGTVGAANALGGSLTGAAPWLAYGAGGGNNGYDFNSSGWGVQSANDAANMGASVNTDLP
jgi:hypothetical protein